MSACRPGLLGRRSAPWELPPALVSVLWALCCVLQPGCVGARHQCGPSRSRVAAVVCMYVCIETKAQATGTSTCRVGGGYVRRMETGATGRACVSPHVRVIVNRESWASPRVREWLLRFGVGSFAECLPFAARGPRPGGSRQPPPRQRGPPVCAARACPNRAVCRVLCDIVREMCKILLVPKLGSCLGCEFYVSPPLPLPLYYYYVYRYYDIPKNTIGHKNNILLFWAPI